MEEVMSLFTYKIFDNISFVLVHLGRRPETLPEVIVSL
jgi:hypothetical protein